MVSAFRQKQPQEGYASIARWCWRPAAHVERHRNFGGRPSRRRLPQKTIKPQVDTHLFRLEPMICAPKTRPPSFGRQRDRFANARTSEDRRPSPKAARRAPRWKKSRRSKKNLAHGRGIAGLMIRSLWLRFFGSNQTPISSFQSWGLVLMKSSISAMHSGFWRMSSSMPCERRCDSGPWKVLFSPMTTFGMP